jgi:hypothetical protein
MLSSNDVNILGNIFNTTYGKSSSGTHGCKVTMQGSRLKVMYSTTAYFASERDMHFQQARLSEESSVRVADLIKDAKSQFKEMSGKALKLEDVSDRDSLELVNASMNNPRRIFVYRRFVEFEILNGSQ